MKLGVKRYLMLPSLDLPLPLTAFSTRRETIDVCDKNHPSSSKFSSAWKSMSSLFLSVSLGIDLSYDGMASKPKCKQLTSSMAKKERVFDLQKEDLKLSNKLCELPQSHAFGFGIAALTWLVIAQVIGNVMICAHFRHRENSKAMKPKIATGLLVFSWISFGIAAVLLGTATSMSRRQAYGKGWLDHECYVVKDGVFIGSGVLILVTTATLLGSAIFTQR
ncbi:hypothetical protein SADUNF_Sadunf01G0188200 [Salix dunnii]|uniref:Uncharacterized protein n=1 Tax=Salix dunnii TaxID=1413687 RepID=A0A835NCP7_9ROSI|nr:hypothetical protein SADUNF_Sadunf01G0188200 [Salix dunnii]